MTIPTIALADGARVPVLGQGTWNMGDGTDHAEELAALREGIDRGLTLIDTAEMYGDGRSETLVGEAIAGRRDAVFLVSKVVPSNATPHGIRRSCAASLRRLRTDRLDLYLLHWRGGEALDAVVETFEALRAAGDIARWGVSNFDTDDVDELDTIPHGRAAATDQVLYNPEHRGIEFDLLPAARTRNMPIMAYSPIGQGGSLLRSATLRAIARRHDVTPAAIALAWCLRDGNVFAIPKAGTVAHVRDNAAAIGLTLTPDDLADLDTAFPPPTRKQPLAML